MQLWLRLTTPSNPQGSSNPNVAHLVKQECLPVFTDMTEIMTRSLKNTLARSLHTATNSPALTPRTAGECVDAFLVDVSTRVYAGKCRLSF